VCDPLDADEDCDGLSDDADPDAVGQTVWYQDGDGDGWGDGEASFEACDATSTTAEVLGDCDDANARVHPGAAEIPDDGVDQDCSGFDTTQWMTGGSGCECSSPGGPPAVGWALVLVPVAWRRRR